MRVIHDQGSEFTGSVFQELLVRTGIKSTPTTSRNPQGNSVIEVVHKSVGQVLRTLVHLNHPQSVAQANQLSKDAMVTEFRQPLQVQSHLEMPGILVQLGHTQRT